MRVNTRREYRRLLVSFALTYFGREVRVRELDHAADGSSITQLTEKYGNNYDQTWSPEGDKIVFTHSTGAQFKHQEIYTMNPDGTGITRITHTNDESFGPDWGSG